MIEMGKILKCFRKEKQLAMKQICTGICSVAMLSGYESGKYTQSFLLFEYFMERIGGCFSDFSIMVTEHEYTYYMWKEEVFEALEQKEWKKLKILLKNQTEVIDACDKKISTQFYAYMYGMMEAMEYQNWEKATQHLKEASIQTNPKMFAILEEDVSLSVMELHILLLYLYYGIQAEIIDLETGKIWFSQLEKYIHEDRIDLEERARIYPKLVCVGIRMFESDMEFTDKMVLCEKAITLLRTTRTFYDITEVLRIYIPLLRMIESKELTFYEKQYEVYCDIFMQGNTDMEFHPEMMVFGKPKVYLISEYLSSKRKEKGLTQEQVSDLIYEPSNYSRVESGKTKPLPSKLKELVKSLDIHWCYCRGELETDNPKVYQLRVMQRTADIEERWQDSLEILKEMEKLLDMENVINYQYIEGEKCKVKYCLGELSSEDAYMRLKFLLELTRKIDMETQYLVYYSQTEIEIVADMAKILRKQKKYEEGIFLLETVLKQISRSKVGFEYQWNGICFALRILGGLYFSANNYEKSLEILNYVYRIYIKNKNTSNLANILDAIADDLEHIGERYSEEYKKLYRQAYYVADFFHIKNVKGIMDNYYKENFDRNMKWYQS